MAHAGLLGRGGHIVASRAAAPVLWCGASLTDFEAHWRSIAFGACGRLVLFGAWWFLLLFLEFFVGGSIAIN